MVIEAIKKAVKKHGAPEIMNSDQGCQFTCADYISVKNYTTKTVKQDIN